MDILDNNKSLKHLNIVKSNIINYNVLNIPDTYLSIFSLVNIKILNILL